MLRFVSLITLVSSYSLSSLLAGSEGDTDDGFSGGGSTSGDQYAAIYFPADNSPSDYIISEDEFNAFKRAWQLNEDWPDSGNKIPIDEASLSGTIYFGYEGAYHVQYDTAGNAVFVPGVPHDNDGNDSTNGTTVTMVGPVPAKICIEINPPEGAVAYCVEDEVPSGWTYWGGGGTYSESDHTVRWGPSPASFEILDYEVFSTLGGRLPDGFNGMVSYDGESQVLDTHHAEPLYGDTFNYLSVIGDEGDVAINPDELWAFALLGNRGADYASVYPQLAFGEVDGRKCVKARLHRYKWASEVVFEFQSSTNLKDWYPVDDIEFKRLEDYSAEVFRFDVTIPCRQADGLPEFYRLEVKHVALE